MRFLKPVLIATLALAMGSSSLADDEPQATPMNGLPESHEQLQQLVAPIALYPDELVAQILAASTYPTQVVEADRWLQKNPDLKGKDLADEVDAQLWDASVKALTQVPSVLANMDKNLSWTSALGEAYVNQEQDVMSAVQAMRKRAEDAGNLRASPQQKVATQENIIVIEPTAADFVYVPTFDPWLVYGAAISPWPGWYAYPGLFWDSPGISFGIGFGVGFWGGFGWGWNHWGCDWRNRVLVFDHRTYITNSRTFANRDRFVGSAGESRHGFFGRKPAPRPSAAFFAPHNSSHFGAFSGFDHGGITRMNSFRGRESFGEFSGGGGFRGGGFHGGFHGGGRR